MSDIRLTSEITVRLVQSMGGDHMVIAAARASTSGEAALEHADPSNAGESAGLINYLMKSRHGSPFEHAAMTVFVHAPAFVWWEWVRHRVAHSYSLESGRYKELEPVFWVPRIGRKIKPSPKHTPARPDFVANEDMRTLAEHRLELAYREAYAQYQAMVSAGVANEVARAALPFAVYYSGWVTVNPRSLMAFLSLRTHEPEATFPSRPQAEIEEAARVCEQMFAEGWPLTHAAFNRNGRVGP